MSILGLLAILPKLIRFLIIPLIVLFLIFSFIKFLKSVPEVLFGAAESTLDAILGTDNTTGEIAVVTADSANFRSGPSTSYKVIKILKKGDTLTVTGRNDNGWLPVQHSGDKGYMSADLLSIGATASSTTQTQTANEQEEAQTASTSGEIANWARGRYSDNIVVNANSITGNNINIAGVQTITQQPLSGHPNLKWAYVYVGNKKYGVVWDRTTYTRSMHDGIELGIGSEARSAFDFYGGSDKDSIFADISREAPAIKVVK